MSRLAALTPRQRIVAVLAACAALAALLLVVRGDPGIPVAGDVRVVKEDPFAFDQGEADEFMERGSRGLAHVLYERSPGGVEATAERTAGFSGRIRTAAEAEGVDSGTLEALVFLESAGRPQVIAGPDPESASGLAQILPGTAVDLLGMSVDLERSKELTAAIERLDERAREARRASGRAKAARRMRALLARRRAVDERFDPEAALAGAARYLALAEERFGREDLAIASYHMGIGNLEGVIEAYLLPEPMEETTRETVEEHGLSYAQLYFDSTPIRNPRTYARLLELGDDSRHYLFRIEAAREIMRLHREDPAELARLIELHADKASAEAVLRPPDQTGRFEDPDSLRDAYQDGELVPVEADRVRLGYQVDQGMGELAGRLGQDAGLYRGLRPEALATLAFIAREVRAIAGQGTTLTVTSTVRDLRYQELLKESNAQAADGYSLHTTGYAFDLGRDLSGREERALVAVLQRLRALAVVDWVYEPGAIHVTAGPEADRLLAGSGLL